MEKDSLQSQWGKIMKMMPKHLDDKLDIIDEKVKQISAGTYCILPAIPTSLYPLIPEALWNYWGMPNGLQRNVQRTDLVKGRVGWFVCQSSHGSQQIKLYKPWIYKNDVNTPLRIRSREIMQLASKEPLEKRKEKVRELYKTMPYRLLKEEPVNLRLKNFYFERKVCSGDFIKIYQVAEGEDQLYWEGEYKEKRTVKFEYQGDVEERYYAVISKYGEPSNTLYFIWMDEIDFVAKGEKKRTKMDILVEKLNKDIYMDRESEIALTWAEYADILFDNNPKVFVNKKAKRPEKYLVKRERIGIFVKEISCMRRKIKIAQKAGFFMRPKKVESSP